MTHDVGLVGATGVVGDVVLRLLAERSFPLGELRLYASRRSAGQTIRWQDRDLTIRALEDGGFEGLDVVISSVDSAIAREWVPGIVEAGAVVVDNSSAFRQDPKVPLVIPEINAHALGSHSGIVSNPNCTTAAVLMAVAPLHRAVGVKAVISSSYQSVSGTGKDAIAELLGQARKAVDQVDALYGYQPLDVGEPQVYRHPLAFNVFPQCETFPAGEDTSTEEAKMVLEVRKILEAPDIEVHATAVRVPVLVGHSASVSLSLTRPVDPHDAREIVAAFPGVRVLDDPPSGIYPTPLASAGIDDVLVGRIRTNPVLPNGLSLFVSGDNLRKGAALNAVQIAEHLVAGSG